MLNITGTHKERKILLLGASSHTFMTRFLDYYITSHFAGL